MQRMEILSGVTRVLLSPADAEAFAPLSFRDASGEYLRLSACSFAPRPVYRLPADSSAAAVKQTANGEVLAFASRPPALIRTVCSVSLRFAYPGSPVLTGLGAHEDGVFDYAARPELLYPHNMKIPIPFLLSSDGWGLLIEASCAMKYRGEASSFVFDLDAAETVSFLVFRGTDAADVLRKLASLVGRPALLPKWAFGYLQSRERYRSAEEVLSVAREFRRRGLGLDAIVQDWLTWREGCWGDKTPDPDRFPSVPALTSALHALHVCFMVSVWPNIDAGRDCEEFAAAGLFLPASRTYDAFSPEARDLYWRQCRRFWLSGGADALWCDSDEPFTDPDWCGPEKRDPETRYRLITDAAALRMDPERMLSYAACHLRGLREHWLRDLPSKRPVFLSRCGGVDSGALGAILWSGDISARWDVLAAQVTEAVRVSCSGIPWWTVDIGGFFTARREPWFWRGDYPSGVDDPAYRELYVRWFQFGALLPVFRAHGTDTPREPWAFGPAFPLLRDLIALRYRLLPYLYSAAAQSCRDGLPMLRAMLTAFGDDPRLRRVADQYMLGPSLLVRPVTRPLSSGGSSTPVLLPPGGWYDFFSSAFFPGDTAPLLPTPLDRFPLLVRAGSILPLSSGAQSTAELSSPADELLIFGGADGAFDLYDDAGDGMDYLRGEYLRLPLRWEEKTSTLFVGAQEGRLRADAVLRVRLLRPDGASACHTLTYTGQPVELHFESGGNNDAIPQG